MDNQHHQKVINASNVFDDRLLDSKNLYLYYFNTIPSISYIGQIDGEKGFTSFKDQYNELITGTHQYRWFKSSAKAYQFSRTVIVLKNNCIVEFDNGYCEIFHDGSAQAFIEDVTKRIGRYKERKKKQPLEINLVIAHSGYMELKAMEVRRTKLDIGLYYENDFKETDELIRRRLNQKNDKGIVLLHGLPGSGKTTYLRYLIGKIRKRVLFLSPSVADKLMSPDFIELLIDNPNTVLVIEDAENVIMDRRHNSGSSVSNLLNISDGLLADFLNIQLICTFNSSLSLVDSALMRKGRLIARYEFGKLSIGKAQRLSKHFGHDMIIDKPMTIAEIANPNEKDHQADRVEIIGFRTRLMNN